jgi:uncharacterized protein (TIGR00369 family)
MANEKTAPPIDNETRKLVAEAAASGSRDVSLASGCPSLAALGAIMVEGSPGDVLLAFTAGVETTQGNGVVSGGTLANMLDTAMAMAVLSALKPGQTCSTISLNVNMLRPGSNGRLYVRAGVEKLGRTVAFAHAQLLSEDQKVLATGTSSLAVIALAAPQ